MAAPMRTAPRIGGREMILNSARRDCFSRPFMESQTGLSGMKNSRTMNSAAGSASARSMPRQHSPMKIFVHSALRQPVASREYSSRK